MRYLLFSAVLFTGVIATSAQELEAILQQHFKAAAQAKMEKIETIVTTGKNLYNMAGIESSFTKYQKRPNNIRVQSDYQGSVVIQTYNGQTGWMFAPAMGIPEPTEMRGDELDAFIKQGEFENPLWRTEEKGDLLELSKSSRDDTADQLKLTTNSGDEFFFFIDRESHLISSITSSTTMGGTAKEIRVELSDYKTIRGIPIAQHVVTKIDDEVVTTIVLDKVVFNTKIDPALFEKPGDE